MDLFEMKGIKPMLISEQVEPYDDPDSIFELKLDGIRCIAYCDGNSVDLRNKRDMKLLPRFPELKLLYEGCKKKCILDGELTVFVHGKPDFFELQKRTLLTDPFKMQLSYSKYPANFVAYDMIYCENRQINEISLMERKQLLSNTILENNLISVSRYIEKEGKMLFAAAKQQELEGVVGKKKSSLYWFGKRTKEWNKIKWMKDDDLVCIGYILKPNHMTSLVLAKYDKTDKLVITSHVTMGVSLEKFKQHGMKVSDCPFDHIPEKHEDVVWTEPVVCTIEFMPSDKEGYRQAVFKGFRDDKLPRECRIEA